MEGSRNSTVIVFELTGGSTWVQERFSRRSKWAAANCFRLSRVCGGAGFGDSACKLRAKKKARGDARLRMFRLSHGIGMGLSDGSVEVAHYDHRRSPPLPCR